MQGHKFGVCIWLDGLTRMEELDRVHLDDALLRKTTFKSSTLERQHGLFHTETNHGLCKLYTACHNGNDRRRVDGGGASQLSRLHRL